VKRAPLPRLPARAADSHKGTYGRVLVIAGSRRMPGAAHLATMGALRGGAGLVILATPASALPLIAPATPCATFEPLAESRAGTLAPGAIDAVLERAADADAVVIGPGLSQERSTVAAVRRLVRAIAAPLVVDADGLNALAGGSSGAAALAGRSHPTVITPHPGELARLDGKPAPRGAAERSARARAAARRLRAIVCLKGHGTVVTDGERVHVNATGNPGMATGGTGDVLAGLLGALLCQTRTPLDAARLAVHVHGRAGDLAARTTGQVALIASDLLDHFGAAFRSPRP
jgi:NAD(P)H-hydrate epimerase